MTLKRSALNKGSVPFLMCLAALVGCGRSSPPPATATRSDQNPGDQDERLEKLRSLGYLSNEGLPKLPAGKGVKVLDAARVSPGYTLVVFAGTCTCQILSQTGEIVRSWSDAPPCHRWEHAELLPEGDLVVVGSRLDEETLPDPIEAGRYVLRLSWKGEVVWRLSIPAHHDVSIAPDGSLRTLVLRRRRVPAIDPDHDFADDMLTSLSTDGKVLESFSLYDVLTSSSVPFTIQRAAEPTHAGRLIDLFHSNAIRTAGVSSLAGNSPMYGPDAVLVTSRHQDELFAIDWRHRRLLWHWGRGVVSGPHEASVLDSGHVLVFDNGLARGWSRVLEVDPLAPEKLVQFAPGGSKFFDRVMGSCQRLPNGNTLIVHSEGGAAFELTPQGTPAWSYEGTQNTPDGHRVKLIRMRRLPESMIDGIEARRGQLLSP